MPLIGNDTNDVDDSSLKGTNRKKQKSVAQKVHVVKRQRRENSSVSTVFHPYKFTAQGEWIAIAYEDNYYVGNFRFRCHTCRRQFCKLRQKI